MIEYRTRTAVRVFDPVDQFARDRGLEGARPRPIGRVRLFLLADHTPGAERVFPRPPEFVVGRNTHGYVISYGDLRDDGGRVLRHAFGGGPYDLRVTSAFYQTADFTGVSIPAAGAQAEPFELLLRPAYGYPFPQTAVPPVPDLTGAPPPALALVRGSVLAPDFTGVANARVTAPGATPYRTAADGEYVLVFPRGASGPVEVTIAVPGAPPVVLPAVAVTSGGTTALAQTALRGRISAPREEIAGATVRVTGAPGAAGVRRDGVWAYCFPADQAAASVTVTAAMPDGRSLSRTAAVTPRTTTTVPEFSFPEMRSSDA
ncbi:carboxypeptidase-like regulatory domain-containing protein [Amycolatopsis samaneae]|uniref:Carboxypeptidase-like regulatory domain-containing protein n=1 Tax=Amycolatopsis samaneae TaxID=664691 RepID=A0ABW5GGZ0_9PSEU